MGFPEELFRLRREKGLSQKELADALGVSQASIGYWEKGQRTPSIEAVRNISNYFGVSLEKLVSTPTLTIDSKQLMNAMDTIWKQRPRAQREYLDKNDYTKEEWKKILEFVNFIESKRKK